MRKILITIIATLFMAQAAVAGNIITFFAPETEIGLSKTSLVAWYDFGDATDAHASYDLTEVGSPSYTSGTPNYGTSVQSTGAQWNSPASTGIISAWGGAAVDCTFGIRFKTGASVSSGDYILKHPNIRFAVRSLTGGSTVFINSASSHNTGYTFTSGTWYSLVAVRDATTGNVQVYINNNDTGYTKCSNGWNDAVITFGGAASAAEDIDIDYMFFYNRELTSDEVAWIYNSGGTRTYADLD